MNKTTFGLVVVLSAGISSCAGSDAATTPPAPVATGIHYSNPSAVQGKVEIDPSWIQHRAANPKASVAYQWADIVLEAAARDIVKVGAKPTIVSRQMAIPFTAMFDAWAAYDATAVGTRFGGALRRPALQRTQHNKEIAISYATYRALLDQYPGDAAWLAAQMRDRGLDPMDESTDRETPEGIGNIAAAAVIEYRKHDGANALGDEVGSDGTPYSDYTHYAPRNPVGTTNDPDKWQPIGFESAKGKIYPSFLTAQWYRVKPLAIERADQFRPGPQPKYGSDQLEKEIDELVAYNGGLSLEDKAIVEFMRDGPRSTGQSGHWIGFAQDVSRRDHHDLDRDVKMFFAVSNTALDAFIAAWEAKRYYDSARPYALVRRAYAGKMITGYLGPGKGFGLIRGEDWTPYSPATFVTPPFPGYVSGHSTVSGACAKMLELFTGSDRFGVYHHHTAGWNTEPDADITKMQSLDGKPANLTSKDVVLTMPTFTATAEMAGISRIMGGYHIQSDNIEGLKMGRSVATYSWPKYQAYFDGTAAVRP